MTAIDTFGAAGGVESLVQRRASYTLILTLAGKGERFRAAGLGGPCWSRPWPAGRTVLDAALAAPVVAGNPPAHIMLVVREDDVLAHGAAMRATASSAGASCSLHGMRSSAGRLHSAFAAAQMLPSHLAQLPVVIADAECLRIGRDLGAAVARLGGRAVAWVDASPHPVDGVPFPLARVRRGRVVGFGVREPGDGILFPTGMVAMSSGMALIGRGSRRRAAKLPMTLHGAFEDMIEDGGDVLFGLVDAARGEATLPIGTPEAYLRATERAERHRAVA